MRSVLLVERSCFLFIFFTLSTCSFTKFSVFPLSSNLFEMMSQFLLNSKVVEHIVFMRNAWLYGILFLRDLGCFNCACTQPAITCSKLTIETLEQGVKYVQS